MRCLNRNVLIATGVALLALWLLAPNLMGAALPLLILAACPLSMGVMVWAMSRARTDEGVRQPGVGGTSD